MRDNRPMIGLVAAALALLGVPLVKHLTAEPPALVRNGPQDYRRIVEDVDAFWRATFAEQFPETGVTYESPSVSFADHVEIVDEPGWVLAGVYSPRHQRIRISLENDEADITHTIAHEFGHHIQHLSGLGRGFKRMAAFSLNGRQAEGSVLYELQAECLAGVWAADAVARGFRGARETVAAHLFREALSKDSTTHGASAARIDWYERGYSSGRASACAEG